MLPSCPHFPFISPPSIPTSSLLLLHPQADVNQTIKVKNSFGGTDEKTLLYIAAEKGSTEIAALLIEAKVRSVCVGGEVKQ